MKAHYRVWLTLVVLLVFSGIVVAQDDPAASIEPTFVLNHTGIIQYIDWSDEDRFIVSYAEQGSCCDRNNWHKIYVWDARNGTLRGSIDVGGVRETIGNPVLNPDGDQVLVVIDNREVRVWSVLTGEALFSLDRDSLSDESVNSPHDWSARWSDDGRIIVTSITYVDHQPLGVDSMQIWDAGSGQLLNESAQRGILAIPVAIWDPNGNRIALWDAGEFMVLDFPTDQVLFNSKSEGTDSSNQASEGYRYSQDMVWSEQGSRLLTRTRSQAQVWDFGR